MLYFHVTIVNRKMLNITCVFFWKGPYFNAEGSAHDYADDVARTLWKEGAGTCFTFKVDALLDAEGIVEVN